MDSSDLFALDVVIDSLKIDDTKEIVCIPAVAFRFLNYPMQVVHLVPPEKVSLLQFADESVLLTTLQSDRNLYSFKTGKSCMFDASFEQLEHAFSTSSRLLYVVLLEFYANSVPTVKAMASLDMLPVFEELVNKSKRFNFERPCCAEATHHVLPMYSRSQLSVCGEVKIDVRLYFLGPRRLASEGFKPNFSSFNMDVSLKSFRESQEQENKQPPVSGRRTPVAQPVVLTANKKLAEGMSQMMAGGDRPKTLVRRREPDEEEDDLDFYYPGEDQQHLIIYEPTKFRCSPLRFDRLEIEKPRRSRFGVYKDGQALEDFAEDDRQPSPFQTFRRQKDKAIQYECRGRSGNRRRRSQSKSPQRQAEPVQMCRHGKNCYSVKCRFLRSGLRSPSPYHPRSTTKQECDRVKRCYTTASCEVWQPQRRFRGSWKRKTPLANVRRGVTPSPPPEPFWYLGKSRPRYVERIVEVPVPPAPRAPAPRRRRSRTPKATRKLFTDAAVNTEGTALVYDEKKPAAQVRIVTPTSQLDENNIATLVNQPSDRLEDMVAEAMANFLVKQLQNMNSRQETTPIKTEATPQPTSTSSSSQPQRPMKSALKPAITKPALGRRHTVANLANVATFTKVDENDEMEPEIEHVMSMTSVAKKEPGDNIAPSLGTVPDLPQYYERRGSESGESVASQTKSSRQKLRLSRSISTDYNDDTFESESASGGVPSPEPFQRSGNFGRRATVDFSALASTRKDSTPAPMSSSMPGQRPLLRRGFTTETEQPSRTPTFIIGDDGKLHAQ